MPASPAIQLKQIALELANDLLERALNLKPELQEIKLRQALIEAQLELAHLSHQRIRNFRSEIDGNLQCPGCWIRNETEVALTPISSDAKNDLFRCGRCGHAVEIQVGLP